ncbi:SAM-dependent methyltransferase [Pelagicoccus albus]|uniref:Class I SAM-dependent methyltransferase n=1 Tax=Pelagicoccus albus TaxID=415222 RepID=A0A7X1B323_9BACT|nr:class I SAM-dependent methyltransferase [Pelagicoccus albus]MBC2604677.1 class I SAM-dependent methyltransferase [Pelagicoccus albus]
MDLNQWDERYSAEEFIYGTKPNDFLASKADLIPQGPVICLADGEGRNGVFLATQGHSVTSIDSSRVGLQKASKLAEKNGVQIETLCCDLAEYEFEPNSATGIVSIFCHLPPELRKKVHAQVYSALKPGGIFILEGYTPEQLKLGTGGPPVADLMHTLDQLKDELSGLEILHAQEVKREVIEGTFHTGMASVVQFVGRKKIASSRAERR